MSSKTILFASLIAAMILSIGSISIVSAETNSDEVTENRTWGLEKHQIFLAFAEHDMPDNKWNEQMLKENIKNYNIETKIGHDVDGYALVALDVQQQKLQNTYNPSLAQEKLHEYLLSVYDVPDTKKDIKASVIEITGQTHYGHGKQLADSLNRMADMGIVSNDVHEKDVEFWNNIAVLSYCDLSNECPAAMVATINNEVNDISTASIIQVSGYTSHVATINIQYQSCETSAQTCYIFKANIGSGYISYEFPGPGHVGDYYLRSDMTNWSGAGGIVFVMGQVTGSLTGSAQYLLDDDGYVTGTKYLYNPNARVWSSPSVTLTSYALS